MLTAARMTFNFKLSTGARKTDFHWGSVFAVSPPAARGWCVKSRPPPRLTDPSGDFCWPSTFWHWLRQRRSAICCTIFNTKWLQMQLCSIYFRFRLFPFDPSIKRRKKLSGEASCPFLPLTDFSTLRFYIHYNYEDIIW